MALLLGPLLGRWAMVVQCYGGTQTLARGRASQMVGRARFREFAWASVVAIGITLGALDAVGLVVVLLAAFVTLGLRVAAHTRVGGLTGRLVAGTGALVEAVVLVVLAALAGLGR